MHSQYWPWYCQTHDPDTYHYWQAKHALPILTIVWWKQSRDASMRLNAVLPHPWVPLTSSSGRNWPHRDLPNETTTNIQVCTMAATQTVLFFTVSQSRPLIHPWVEPTDTLTSSLSGSLLRSYSQIWTVCSVEENLWQMFVKRSKAYIALRWNSASELRHVSCQTGSHSVTCHLTQVNAPLLNPSQ